MYTIQKYVLEKMKEKGIRRPEFVHRIGYSNVSKGCRRFDEFINGKDYNRKIIENIYKAFDVAKEEVDDKLRATKLEIQREIEEENARQADFERKSFVPYLYCHTEYKRPSSIWLCAMIQADKTRNLPLYFNSLSRKDQNSAVKKLIEEILKRHNGQIPTFGKIICFTVRRDYDDIESERKVYDLKGDVIKKPAEEYRKISIGRATLTLKGKNLLPLLRSL